MIFQGQLKEQMWTWGTIWEYIGAQKKGEGIENVMRNLLGAIEEHKWQQIYLHQNVHNIIGSPVGNKTPSSTLT
jgi:hypothetical protein